jgi:hypothetical protein
MSITSINNIRIYRTFSLATFYHVPSTNDGSRNEQRSVLYHLSTIKAQDRMLNRSACKIGSREQNGSGMGIGPACWRVGDPRTVPGTVRLRVYDIGSDMVARRPARRCRVARYRAGYAYTTHPRFPLPSLSLLNDTTYDT